jgi:hypothetical protein
MNFQSSRVLGVDFTRLVLPSITRGPEPLSVGLAAMNTVLTVQFKRRPHKISRFRSCIAREDRLSMISSPILIFRICIHVWCPFHIPSCLPFLPEIWLRVSVTVAEGTLGGFSWAASVRSQFGSLHPIPKIRTKGHGDSGAGPLRVNDVLPNLFRVSSACKKAVR